MFGTRNPKLQAGLPVPEEAVAEEEGRAEVSAQFDRTQNIVIEGLGSKCSESGIQAFLKGASDFMPVSMKIVKYALCVPSTL